MAEIDVFTVDASRPTERLDRYLTEIYTQCSRGEIQRLLGEGCIKVNGRPPKPTQAPRCGDVIEVRWPSPKSTEVAAQEIPLDVIFEDGDLLVLNKTPDIVVHPSAGHEDGTLVNALLHHCEGELSGIGGVQRPGIVHRLDLDTSGCLVIAKNDHAHRELQDQFALRRVEKIYQCLACGFPNPAEGEIRTSIARHASHRKKMAVVEDNRQGARPAWTSYRILERLTGTSFVECKLHTGRTHQIRVHLQHLGNPVLGDDVYGARPSLRVKEETGYAAPRQLLHARRLAFRHPRTGQWREFDAPLPEDFKEAIALLRPANGAAGNS
jgi:23S rRNA pseudouridine1911/1915/1917 synthase